MGSESEKGVSRFSISLPQGLARDLDSLCKKKGYESRSLAIAEMVRDSLVDFQQEETSSKEIAGTISLVYDHHKPTLQKELTSIQHDHHEIIISAMHVHLDHDNCLEVLVLKGKAKVLQQMANRLIQVKGVKHGKFTVTTTGKDLN